MALGSFGGGLSVGGLGAVVVNILGNDAQLKAVLGSDEAALRAFQTSGTKSATGFSKAATNAYLLAGAAAVGFAAVAIHSYQEHQKVLSQLQNAIDNTPTLVGASIKAFEDQATALQHLTGIQDEEILSADTVLSRFKLTGAQIQQVIPLVLDYARATGQDAASAAQNLGRAFVGNSRALKTIGIQFKNTGDTAKDFTTIVGLLQAKVGGFSTAFGQTLAGKIAIFRAELDDVAEAAGKALLPAMTAIVGVLSKLLTVLRPLAGQLPLILGALIGWKALTFIPPLLTAIEAGLLRVAAAAESRTLLSAAIGMEALGVATAAALPVLGLGAAALVLVGIGLSKVDTTALEAAQHFARAGSGAIGVGRVWQSNVQSLADAHETLATGISDADLAAGVFTAEQDKAQAAANKTTIALIAQAQALNQLAGGFLSIQGAVLGARSAGLAYDQAVQQLNKDTKANTDANKDNNVSALQLRQDHLNVRQAMLNRVQTQVALTGSIQDFAAKEQTAGKSTSEIAREVRAYGRSALLSKAQIDELVTSTLSAIGAYGRMPGSVITKVSAPGLSSVIQNAIDYRAILAGIPRSITTRFRNARNQALPTATGFHGWVQQPTLFLSGEAGRERVDITPANEMGRNRGGTRGGDTFIINGERVAPTSEDFAHILRRARMLSGV